MFSLGLDMIILVIGLYLFRKFYNLCDCAGQCVCPVSFYQIIGLVLVFLSILYFIFLVIECVIRFIKVKH